ncbi:translocation/assembly module TamB domain-containing protein [Halocella sp. SP3-1]|uniref:translocation/assembly module TamB domain-containing protein n=1 Tax=Halocella sp. SP3-1 TaxID=2382161 RepID=UPI000F756C09|nr:translocation/assembly module TamB domain-containing protein [Halocella sp. SP3-1]AZO93957.1 hypothetical protein D7D81_04780 [Halocella sp. SP3-1]
MKTKSIIYLSLLMFFILTAVFIMKVSTEIIDLKEEIINYIDEVYQLKIEVGSIDFWSFTALSLYDTEVLLDHDNISFSSPEVKLYYNPLELIFSQKKIIDGIKQIKFINPVLNVKNQATGDAGSVDQVIKDYLPSGKKPVQLIVQDGIVQYSGEGQEIRLEKLDLALLIDEEGWQGDLKTGFFDLAKLSSPLEQIFSEQQGSIQNLTGQGSLELIFQGKGVTVRDYSGRLLLDGVEGLISCTDYLDDEVFNDLSGEILFDSSSQQLQLNGLYLNFFKTAVQLNGSLDFSRDTPEISARVYSSDFNPERIDILKEYLPISGTGMVELLMAGDLSSPELQLDYSLSDGELFNKEQPWKQEIAGLDTVMRYHDGFLYLDYFNLNLNQESYFSASGLIKQDELEYSIDLQGKNIELGLVEEYLPDYKLPTATGKIDINSSISGQGLDLDRLNLLGDFRISNSAVKDYRLDLIEGQFWLSQKALLIQQGLVKTPYGNMNFSGELNLLNKKLAFSYENSQLDLSLLTPLLDKKLSLKGLASIKGRVDGYLDEPELTARISMDDGMLDKYQFSNLNFRAEYIEDKLSVPALSCEYQGAAVEASGNLTPSLQASIMMEDLPYQDLAKISGMSIPLEGLFDLSLGISGSFTSPEIKGEVFSQETSLVYQNFSYSLDRLSALFSWGDNTLLLEDLDLHRDRTHLTAEGEIIEEEEINLDFILNELDFEEYLPEMALKGDASIKGTMTGKLSNPELNGLIVADSIIYNNYMIDGLVGELSYSDDKIIITNSYLRCGSDDYNIHGKLTNLSKDIKLDLILETERGKIKDLLNRYYTGLPIPEDYYFSGSVVVGGSITTPEAEVDLSFFGAEESQGTVTMIGDIKDGFNLKLKGQGVEIEQIPAIIDRDINLKGKLDFQGEITGNFDSYQLKLATSLLDVGIGNSTIESIKGNLSFTQTGLLYLEQVLTDSADRTLTFSGYIPVKKTAGEYDLKTDFQGFPLRVVGDYFPSLPRIRGFVDGNISLSGLIDDPQFNGRLALEGAGFNSDYLKISGLHGEVLFSGETISIPRLKGKSGKGDIIIEGKIRPFSIDDNYHLSIYGDDIPLDYGSFDGEIDPRLKITGSFSRPFIQGDIITHDLEIGIPIKWPSGDAKGEIYLDLTLYPDEDVYLRNKYFDILIQSGSFRLLNINGNLQFEGELSSEQGTLTYYNNKFFLEEATAEFNRYEELLPNLDVKAWTRIDGNRIEVQFKGLPGQMITTFTSEPTLSEEEIMALLTRSGGIGEFVAGNLSGVFSQEIYRYIRDYIQLDILKEIEYGVKEAFSLDEFEIDTYNLGFAQEMTLYLGEYIGDDIYLQYSTTLGPGGNGDNQFSLKYYLDDNFIIKGDLFEDNAYSIGFETGFDF